MFPAQLPNAPDMLTGPSRDALHTRPRPVWRTAISRANRAFLAVQVSHHGKYSIERLIALDEYVRKTSWARVLILCLITPLPVIILVLSQESVPLHDPAEGWRANYGIWIRAAVVSGAVSQSVLVQLLHLVDDVAMSRQQVAAIVLIMMVGYAAMSILIADKVFFPIPFMSITMTVPFFLLIVSAFYFVVGGQAVRQVLQHKRQLFRYFVLLASQTSMIIIYPAYQVLFQAAADSGYELVVVGLLPVLKVVMKNIVSLSFNRTQDLMPQGVIFTVDFFNAFYIATSMQNASSATTVVVIMAVDLFNTAVSLNGLRRGTSRIIALLHKAGTLASSDPTHFDLLHTASLLCQSSDDFETQNRSGIQLRSCLHYQLSTDGRNLLDHLSKYQGYRSSISYKSGHSFAQLGTTQKASKKRRWRCGGGQSAVVHPTVEIRTESKLASSDRVKPRRRSELREALELLFTSECLVLSEFLESVVPVLYANYIVVMVHLPSARYHLEMDGITDDNVGSKVQAVFAYALLEFVSFLVMAVVVQRRCGMKILHHLAFVLETHMLLIQNQLITWTLLTLVSRVAHFGVDFSFQFDWVKT